MKVGMSLFGVDIRYDDDLATESIIQNKVRLVPVGYGKEVG